MIVYLPGNSADMDTNTTINIAIRRFSLRNPWSFHDAVAGSLDAVNAGVFEEIWKEATSDRHWKQSDLAACARETSSVLQQRFGFLEPDAADAVASAAAYEWR
jgi:hypothetical protein